MWSRVVHSRHCMQALQCGNRVKFVVLDAISSSLLFMNVKNDTILVWRTYLAPTTSSSLHHYIDRAQKKIQQTEKQKLPSQIYNHLYKQDTEPKTTPQNETNKTNVEPGRTINFPWQNSSVEMHPRMESCRYKNKTQLLFSHCVLCWHCIAIASHVHILILQCSWFISAFKVFLIVITDKTFDVACGAGANHFCSSPAIFLVRAQSQLPIVFSTM